MKLKLAYFGTPGFSACFLDKLLTDKDLPVEVSLVITQPDQPLGRKKILTASPVKKIAEKYGVEIVATMGDTHGGPPKTASRRSGDAIFGGNAGQDPLYKKLIGLDLALVYAYGRILPESILKLPRLGFLNIHPSLLPKYRGPSPTTYPLILGDKKTGVTLMKMDEKMDHGPIIDAVEFEIPKTMKRPELEEALTDLGYELFKKSVSVIASGAKQSHEIAASQTPRDDMKSTPQNHADATYTHLLKKQDGYVPLSVVRKALRLRSGQALDNDPLTFDDLPQIIKDYFEKNPNAKYIDSGVANAPQNDPSTVRQGSLQAGSGQAVILASNPPIGGKRDQNLKQYPASQVIFHLYRGLWPWPGIWTKININGSEKRLKLIDLSLILHTSRLPKPGTGGQANYILHISKIQLEGKNTVSFEEFNSAYKIF